MKLRLVIAIGAASMVGCAALIGLGDYEIGGGDAGVPADGAATSDSPSSGSGDAGADTSVPPPPDTTPHFCTMFDVAPTFCADFDVANDPNPARGWDPIELDAGTTVETVTDRSVTAPRSLHGQSQSSYAVVAKTFLGAATIFVEADVMVPKPGENPSAIAPIALRVPADPELQVWFFVAGPTGNHYFQSGYSDFSMPQPKPPAIQYEAWHHLSLRMRFTEAATLIDATVDGLVYWKDHATTRVWPIGGPVTLFAGTIPYQLTSPAETWVDNVVVQTQ